MANFQELQQAIVDLTAQVEATKGTEASAKTLIETFGQQVTAAVTAALEANDAADATSIADAKAAIQGVQQQFAASAADLGAAVAANSGNPPA